MSRCGKVELGKDCARVVRRTLRHMAKFNPPKSLNRRNMIMKAVGFTVPYTLLCSKINLCHWELTDDQKRQFYVETTTVSEKARTRRADDVNRKKVSYKYFFLKDDEKIRVCKEFYLCTLCIDAKRIVNTHKTKNKNYWNTRSVQEG